ncbi:nitroreductase family protein [Plantactinospora sonchi]|uniref:Nitroreductase domain-containing protein n=1 Tax=Plantactinospora sonchi TaxID=1544735 RepID=A0ABU7RLF5_9ACTN
MPEQFPVLPQVGEIYFVEESARAESALLNSCLQIGYFILGVRTIGLAAGPMTGFEPDKVTEEFFPHGRRRALVVVYIGRPAPDAWYDRLPRLSYERVFISH